MSAVEQAPDYSTRGVGPERESLWERLSGGRKDGWQIALGAVAISMSLFTIYSTTIGVL